MAFYILFFVTCLYSYVPESLAPVVEFMNKKTYACLKKEDRSMQNKMFDAINSDLCEPIKLTNSSAVFALNKTDCVIKRFKEKKNSSRNEIKIAMELEHPNIIINYIAFNQEYKNEKIGWIVSEYLDVPIAKKDFKNENEIRRMCRDVCKGLEYMHGKDIAHLDMKLGNVMGKMQNTKQYDNNFVENLMKEVQADMSKDKYKLKVYNGMSVMFPFLELSNEENKEEEKQKLGNTKKMKTRSSRRSKRADEYCSFFGEASQYDHSCIGSDNIIEVSYTDYTLYKEDSKKELRSFVKNILENDNKHINVSYYVKNFIGNGFEQKNDSSNFYENSSPVHRNFKLGKKDITYKIIDFGFSRYIKGDDVLDLKNRYYGTYPYTPPEIYFDSIYSKKSDIWCLGAMVYFLTTNEKLFYHSNGDRNYHEYEDFLNQRIGFHFGNYSSDLKDFVKKCMSKNYKNRPTAKELLNHPFLRKIF